MDKVHGKGERAEGFHVQQPSGHTRRAYARPAVVSSAVFDTLALGCDLTGPMGCDEQGALENS